MVGCYGPASLGSVGSSACCAVTCSVKSQRSIVEDMGTSVPHHMEPTCMFTSRLLAIAVQVGLYCTVLYSWASGTDLQLRAVCEYP